MWPDVHPAAGHTHLPAFIPDPGGSDVLMTVMAIFLVVAVLAVGNLFLRLHTLPERMAHKTHKLQFEIVAVLGLIALFTHMHIFWVIGLLLALIDLPDFGTPLRSMAGPSKRWPATSLAPAGARSPARRSSPPPTVEGARARRSSSAADRDGGTLSEGPGPGGPRRPRPVPVPARDKETADA